jgi:hypothetical protein
VAESLNANAIFEQSRRLPKGLSRFMFIGFGRSVVNTSLLQSSLAITVFVVLSVAGWQVIHIRQTSAGNVASFRRLVYH